MTASLLRATCLRMAAHLLRRGSSQFCGVMRGLVTPRRPMDRPGGRAEEA